MKKNTTKRALWMSVLSLFLCFSMLVGTTFAWFTDEVKTNVNKIVAGNLDVNLYWTTDPDNNTVADPWTPVTANTNVFDGIGRWEPGKTQVVYLKVVNEGTLALKYQLGINIARETAGTNVDGASFKLSDYIKYGVKPYSATYADRAAAIADVESVATQLNVAYNSGTLELQPGDDAVVALVVYMPTTVGNEANYKKDTTAPEIDLGINLFATQLQSESDSFGPDYDQGAFLPVVPETMPEAGEDLVLNGSEESKVTVTVPAAVLAGLDDSVTALSVAASAPVIDAQNKTVTFSTIELHDQNGNEVDLTAANAKVTVKLPVGNAFADGEQVEIYHDGAFVTYATVDNGYISYEVSHFCEVSITVAEEVELDNTIDSVKEFMAFAAAVNAGKDYKGETVVLGADLDLAGVTWTPIGTSSNPFKGTFDGNGKVISNLSVLMAGKSNVGLFGFTTEGEIKNVTVENAKVAGRLNVAVVSGTPYTSKYTNITVKGHVEVDGMAYVGAVGGKNAYANWTDITVNVDSTSYVNANSVENGTAYRTYVGGVVGFNGEGGHTFKNITSNIAVIGSTCDVGGAFGIAHYNNKFENVTVTGTVTGAEGAYEVGGIAGVWHNENGTTVTFTNCTYTGNLPIVGAAYGAGNGKLIVNGDEVVASAAALKAALNVTTGDATVELFCDINMKGTAWTPIYVDGYQGAGVVTVEGKGYTITGLSAPLFKGGFAGKSGIVIKNLTIADSNIVSTSGLGGGAFIDTADSMHIITLDNCHLVNSTVTGERTGGLIGWCSGYAKLDDGPVKAYVTITDCSVVDSTVTGAGSAGAIAGHPGASDYTYTTIENCVVKNVDVVSYEPVSSWRTGAVVGTANNGHVVINDVTVKDVTLTQDGVTATETKLFGRFVPAGTGTLVIDGAPVVATTEALQEAINAGEGKVVLGAGNYTLPSVSNGDVTISGTKDTVITVEKPNYSGSDVTFNGVTIKGSGYSTGVQHVNTVTYNGATIVGEMCLYGEKVVFNDCTFELNGQYIWTYGAAEVEFNNCTFNTTGKAILIYNEGAGASKVTVKGCTFNATAGAKAGAIANQNCAAIEIDNFQSSGTGAAHVLIAEGNTYSDYFSGEWRIKSFTAGNAVTVNGTEYTQIAIDGKLMTIDANKNVTVQ